MKVLVDGEEVREVSSGGPPLAEVYREVVGGLLREGRTVVAVAVDGRTLTGDDLTGALDAEHDLAGTMELNTVKTVELVCGTLVEVSGHLERLRDGLKSAVTHLGRSERAEALQALRPTLEIWLAVCEAVQKVCVLSQVELRDGGNDLGIARLQQSLAGSLREFHTAVEQEDWVKLADLLEYELSPSVDRWETLVGSLLDRLQGDRNT